MNTHRVFSEEEYKKAKLYLAAKVASMMGRKLEEDDWGEVYRKAKDLPDQGWSNLHIDVNHSGLGVEFKMLRVPRLGDKSIKSVCGTSLMHPSATRSIRIDDTNQSAEAVMNDVFGQYRALIESRTERVRQSNPDGSADMRVGWLIWEDKLTEFLYFEEEMLSPDPENYYAEWNETKTRGVRKSSKSLWVFEKETNKKRYSVTTSAGIKIQPYFDVPAPNDKYLYYFRVQSELLNEETIILWVSAATAKLLVEKLGSIDRNTVSKAILDVAGRVENSTEKASRQLEYAVPIQITREAYTAMSETWGAVSDEHRVQLLLHAMD